MKFTRFPYEQLNRLYNKEKINRKKKNTIKCLDQSTSRTKTSSRCDHLQSLFYNNYNYYNYLDANVTSSSKWAQYVLTQVYSCFEEF